MKRNTFLILAVLVSLGFVVRAFSDGNPWDGFKKQIEATKASERAH